MPLSDMYRTMLESTNPATWETNRQKQLMGEYELESKRRSMDAEQQLRQLYSSGGPVSTQNVMAISPELGIKMQQAGNQAYLQQLQAEDLMRKQQEYQAKTYAQYLGPVADTYFDDMRSGMKPEMALQKFRSAVGSSQKELEEKHGIRPQADFTQFSPEQILDRTTGLGVPSRHYKSREEEQKSQLQMRERMAPSYSDIKPTWDSQRGQWISTPQTQAPSFSGASAEELNMIEKSLPGMPEGPEKEGLKRFLAEKKGMPQAQTPTGLIPLADIKAQEAGAKRAAELNVEEQQMSKKATNAYDMLPSPDRIRNLIKGSVSGDLEYWANRAGGIVGKSLEAGDMTGALKVIEGQMADTVAMFPGAQSDKELEARMKTIGNPSGEISADTRLKAFDEWQERMQKYAAQHADYDDTKLVDMVKDKKLTADQALQIRKRRMSGGL